DSSYFETVNVYEVPDLSTAIHTPISTKKEMTVFPNPNHGKFTVADELFDGNAVLRIYNSFGIMLVDKQMKEFSAGNGFYQFDFSYLPKGSYIISVTDNQQTNAQQFFIQ
ncbi:MAG TPA: T9SS type A sorting domain-containing protein, partial [Chitinophagales bacterium]|nr:T9SS type A sorting domain-containing protein [Chitinophagales bacterium]